MKSKKCQEGMSAWHIALVLYGALVVVFSLYIVTPILVDLSPQMDTYAPVFLIL